MAKKKKPDNQSKQLPEYGELISIMQNETASIVTDYIRQYIGVIQGQGFNPKGQSAIYMNQDRVQKYQSYQELAFYDLYAEVERDPKVRSILDSAKINVVEMDWAVYPYKSKYDKEPSSRNQAIADYVEEQLAKIEYLPQHLYALMGALGMGFAVTEIVWGMDNEKVFIKELLNRPPRRFQFNATDRKLRIRNIDDPYYGKELPDKKFIVHRCSAQWSDPFGDAIDQSLYWMWLFKKTVIKFWMQHLQVGASSIPIVKHPAGANDVLKGEALEIAKMIRNGAYGRLPANFELLWAEAKNAIQNAEAYGGFVRMCDDQMSECVNGQTLTGAASSAEGKGTQALGKEHRMTQNARDVYRAKGLSNTLTNQIIKWLVDFNYANVEGYPVYRPDLEEPDDLAKESQIVKTVSDAGYDFDPTELSEKFSYTITKKEPLKLNPVNLLEKKPEGKTPEELEKENEDEKK
jgi:phage gp29-like protein